MTGPLVRRPIRPIGAAVLQTDGGDADARLSDTLAASGFGVVVVPLGFSLDVGFDLAAIEFPGMPRVVAASGARTSGARRFANQHGLDGVIALNPSVGRSVGRGETPAMVFVDRSLIAQRVWGRLASRFVGASYQIVDGSFGTEVDAWWSAPGEIYREPVGGRTVGAIAAAAALTIVPAAVSMATPGSLVPSASAPADPFDSGVSVGSQRIQGDGVGTSKLDKTPAGDGVAVPATAIAGDGSKLVAPLATGSIELTGGNGLHWFVNTDITFGTTSSASGAASEASFTTSAAGVTTTGGGTTASSLNDAFDGYNSLFVDVGGTTIGTSTNSYRPTGSPTADAVCAVEQYNFPTATMQGLDVSRTVFVPADGNFARWVNVLSNPTGAPITVGLGTANNLGSDSNTIITGSANSDMVGDLTDTWVGTMQNFSGSTSSDPRLGHVIQGAGAPVAATAVNFVVGDDNPYWAWDVTVQPGETVVFMNFAAGEVSLAAANTSAASLASLAVIGDGTAPALRCMTEAQLGALQNFALPGVTVSSITVSETAGNASVVFTRAASGAAATVTFAVTAGTATLGSDYSAPAAFTVAFAAGDTEATVQIPLIDDTDIEPDETFVVDVTGVTGFVTGVGAQGTVTIQSDDVAATTTTTTITPTTTTTTLVAPTSTAVPLPPTTLAPLVTLPATGTDSSGALGWIALLLTAMGGALVRITRRRTA